MHKTSPVIRRVTAEETHPVWEATCYVSRQITPNGTSSKVSTMLRRFVPAGDGYHAIDVGMTPDEARAYARDLVATANEAVAHDRHRDETARNGGKV